MIRKKTIQFLSLCLFSASLFALPAGAADYPPAMNYDDYTEFFSLDKSKAKLLIDWQLNKMRYYLPQRDAVIRLDIVDDSGKVLTTKERHFTYKNGKSLSVDFDRECGSPCLNGPNSLILDPGVYWFVASENGKVFSADWFEVRSYKLGEGRFAKGNLSYVYLPTTQMARLEFQDDGDFEVELGFAGEAAVGEQSQVSYPIQATLKYNGKVMAALPGQMRGTEHKVHLPPHSTMKSLNLSRVKNNAALKRADFKDGQYELDIQLNGKAYRKFKFQIQGGKIKYQGRQQENTQPVSRMIVSEKGYWLWNTYAKEPARNLPQFKLSAAAPSTAQTNKASESSADPVGDALKQLPKLPF